MFTHGFGLTLSKPSIIQVSQNGHCLISTEALTKSCSAGITSYLPLSSFLIQTFTCIPAARRLGAGVVLLQIVFEFGLGHGFRFCHEVLMGL